MAIPAILRTSGTSLEGGAPRPGAICAREEAEGEDPELATSAGCSFAGAWVVWPKVKQFFADNGVAIEWNNHKPAVRQEG
jgi:hypothetical protein